MSNNFTTDVRLHDMDIATIVAVLRHVRKEFKTIDKSLDKDLKRIEEQLDSLI